MKAWGHLQKITKLGLLTTIIVAQLPQVSAQPVPGLDRPIMQFTPEQFQEIQQMYFACPVIPAPAGLQAQDLPHSVNLLPHLSYIPVERDQGGCNDCWQWASTGLVEIEQDIRTGLHDRLSVQFINSCGPNCCVQGTLEEFTNFYTGTKFAIPWSNPNATFVSRNGTCDAAPCGSIGTLPRYGVISLPHYRIETRDIPQAQAILNLKSALSRGFPVWFSFFLGTGDEWNTFGQFWNTQPETTVWSDFFCTGLIDSGSGGHAVLVVGYNDEDPQNRYWIVLNSWGTAGGKRPNGLFRVAMDIDYNCGYGGEFSRFRKLFFETLDVSFAPVPTITSQPTSQRLLVGSTATFNVGATSVIGIFYQWLQNGTPIPGASSATLTIPNVQLSDAGTYSVIVSNFFKSALLSAPASLTVFTPQPTNPPTILAIAANPAILQPPNHKLVPVTVSVSTQPQATSSKIISVTSNEPVNGIGDGNTSPDWIITGDLTLQLRSERSGPNKTGRVYTIAVQCTDIFGNSATKNVFVTVPHDNGH